MSSFWIGLLIIVACIIWLPILCKIPPRRPDLPCRECGCADRPTRFSAWTQWSGAGRRYRRDFLCQPCAHQWHARPGEEAQTRGKVRS